MTLLCRGIWLKATASEAHISSRYLIQLHRPKVHAGTLPAEKSWLTWEGERMMFSNLKEKAEGTDRMARFVNCSGEPTVLRIKKDASFETLYFSNILRKRFVPKLQMQTAGMKSLSEALKS